MEARARARFPRRVRCRPPGGALRTVEEPGVSEPCPPRAGTGDGVGRGPFPLFENPVMSHDWLASVCQAEPAVSARKEVVSISTVGGPGLLARRALTQAPAWPCAPGRGPRSHTEPRQFLTSARLAALVLVLAAQATDARQAFRRMRGPLHSHTLDLGTGTLTSGAHVLDRAAGSSAPVISDFWNLDLGGFVGTDTGGGFCEWFDAGTKGFQNNASDLMSSVVLAYCSSMLDVHSGGPGSSFKLGFYEGYTAGGGSSSTAVLAITLTGLPANSVSSSFFGSCRPHALRLQLDQLVSFADGPIGYSWRFLDVGTSGPLSGTFPWLACVASCTGPGPDAQGMTPGVDRYCPPGTLLPPLPPSTFQSLAISIEEACDRTATIVNSNSLSQPNPDILTSDPVIVGQPWTASLTLGLARTKAAQWTVLFGHSPVNPPNGAAVPTFTSGLNFGTSPSGRMLLCFLQNPGPSLSGTHSGVAGSTSTLAPHVIPPDLALVSVFWCGQALVLGRVPGDVGPPSARLSSAVSGVIGTGP